MKSFLGCRWISSQPSSSISQYAMDDNVSPMPDSSKIPFLMEQFWKTSSSKGILLCPSSFHSSWMTEMKQPWSIFWSSLWPFCHQGTNNHTATFSSTRQILDAHQDTQKLQKPWRYKDQQYHCVDIPVLRSSTDKPAWNNFHFLSLLDYLKHSIAKSLLRVWGVWSWGLAVLCPLFKKFLRFENDLLYCQIY